MKGKQMIRFVLARDLDAFPRLRDSMFQDRARQFHDRLGWNVDVDLHGHERDEYDACGPLYVIWESPDGRHGGSMRFLPTTGRTMVNDHFLHVTNGARIEDPAIWECTRFCLSERASGRVAAALMLAGGELMQQFRVKRFAGVFDAPMLRIYKAIGASPEVLGSAGEGKDRISVGLWEFSETAQRKVAMRAGISPMLMSLWFERSLGAGIDMTMVA